MTNQLTGRAKFEARVEALMGDRDALKKRIATLRGAASAAGNSEEFIMCSRAIDGDEHALWTCARILVAMGEEQRIAKGTPGHGANAGGGGGGAGIPGAAAVMTGAGGGGGLSDSLNVEAAIEQALKPMGEMMSEMMKTLSAAVEGVATAGEELAGQLDALEERLEALERKFQAVPATFGSAATVIADLQQANTARHNETEEIATNVLAIQEKIPNLVALSHRLDALTEALESVQDEVIALDSKVLDLQREHDQTEARLESEIKSVADDVYTLERASR